MYNVRNGSIMCHFDNCYFNRHDLSTIIIIIFQHHDLNLSCFSTPDYSTSQKTLWQPVNNASSSPTCFIINEWVLTYHNSHLTFPIMNIIITPRGFSQKHSVLGLSEMTPVFVISFIKNEMKINLYIFLPPFFWSGYILGALS